MTENKPDIVVVKKSKLADSPAHNSEAEDIMYQIIERSALAGEWISIPLDELTLVQPGNRMAFESPLREGLTNLRIAGLVTESRREEDGKTVIEVTDTFKDYYARIKAKK